MNYQETLDYLMSKLPMFQRVGAAAFKKDLTNIRLLCDALGNPQRKFRAIHVGGTNGKGSTSHMLAAVLQSAGYKVGLYTSPHYLDFRERVRVQGEMMSEAFVVDFVEKLNPYIESIQPSFFEITVALAFEYFAQQEVEIGVIEVGMGGRFDSTNILENPLLSIITNIDLDHQQFLGETRDLIAFEKAGIIKDNCPVVIGERHIETDQVFLAKAMESNADLYFACDMVAAQRIGLNPQTQNAQYEILPMDPIMNPLEIYQMEIGLTGNYQYNNLQTVLTSIAVLIKEYELKIHRDDVINGCENVVALTNIMGRWQKLKDKPLTIADAAHNVHGLKYIVSALEELAPQHLHFVFGMVNDKSAAKVFEILPKKNTTYYFCKADIPRGRDAQDLYDEAKQYGLEGYVYTSVKAALQAAQGFSAAENALHGDNYSMVYVGGSIFIVAEAL